jgi:hypothetical protein
VDHLDEVEELILAPQLLDAVLLLPGSIGGYP